ASGGLRGVSPLNGVQPLLELRPGKDPALSARLAPILEDDEGGDGPYTIGGGRRGLLFGVDFQGDQISSPLAGDLIHDRTSHTAGLAPRRPEIHQDGNRRGRDNPVEGGGIDILRLAREIQRVLAPSTDCLRSTFPFRRGDSVDGPARFATKHFASGRDLASFSFLYWWRPPLRGDRGLGHTRPPT